jgi:hypothetical protein
MLTANQRKEREAHRKELRRCRRLCFGLTAALNNYNREKITKWQRLVIDHYSKDKTITKQEER